MSELSGHSLEDRTVPETGLLPSDDEMIQLRNSLLFLHGMSAESRLGSTTVSETVLQNERFCSASVGIEVDQEDITVRQQGKVAVESGYRETIRTYSIKGRFPTANSSSYRAETGDYDKRGNCLVSSSVLVDSVPILSKNRYIYLGTVVDAAMKVETGEEAETEDKAPKTLDDYFHYPVRLLARLGLINLDRK